MPVAESTEQPECFRNEIVKVRGREKMRVIKEKRNVRVFYSMGVLFCSFAR